MAERRWYVHGKVQSMKEKPTFCLYLQMATKIETIFSSLTSQSGRRLSEFYAQIYSEFNPHRAAEIYQYIHTIHNASLAYKWDNVAYYDYVFRQNMAENPQRSWGKNIH